MRPTWASRRPGRSSAASIISGRLVAAITNTPWSPSTPSSAVSSWFTTLSVTPVESCPLFRGHSVSVFVLLWASSAVRSWFTLLYLSRPSSHAPRARPQLLCQYSYFCSHQAQSAAGSPLYPSRPSSHAPCLGGIPCQYFICTFVGIKRSEKLAHCTLSVRPVESCPLF